MPSPRPRALVTGASAGIGAEYARLLARDGCDLVLVARRRHLLDALAERLRHEAGTAIEVIAADLTDPAQLAAVEARVAADQQLRLLINNAGFGGYGPFVELAPEIADQLIDLHIRAVVHLTRAALPGMVRRQSGGVINVASLLAVSGAVPPDPLPHRAVYAGAKAFLLTFTQALAGELRNSEVAVQVCLPGLVDTEFHAIVGRDRTKMPPMMAPADLAAASLAALRLREVVCIPGIEDMSLFEQMSEAQRAMLGYATTATPARRYRQGAL